MLRDILWARIFSKEVLPEPLGPMIATNSPGLTYPDELNKIYFFFATGGSFLFLFYFTKYGAKKLTLSQRKYVRSYPSKFFEKVSNNSSFF